MKKNEARLNVFANLLKRIFVDDWVMKVVALTITLTLWFGVTSLRAPTTTRLRGVALNPLIANDLEITNTPLEEIDVVVRGDKGKVDQLNPRNLVASLDLTDIREGDRTIQITPQDISIDLPGGVQVIGVQPDKMAVKLEKVEEREVPVRVQVKGAPDEGFEVYAIRPTPEKVRVRGPSSFVDAINFVTAEEVDVAGKRNNFTIQQIPLTMVNPKVTFISAATTNVFVRIGRKRIERLLVVRYSTKTRNGRANVTLYGADTIIERLTPADITIVEQTDDSGRSRLSVVLPDSAADSVVVRSVKYNE